MTKERYFLHDIARIRGMNTTRVTQLSQKLGIVPVKHADSTGPRKLVSFTRAQFLAMMEEAQYKQVVIDGRTYWVQYLVEDF